MKLMVFLFLTTLFWGMAAIFDKLALGKTSPFTGMMVRQFILTGILLAVGVGSGRLGTLGTLDGRSIVLFGLSGICGGAAGLWTYYHALRLGGASLVVPITATYPLIAVLLSWLILQESLTISRIIGTALIVLGVWLVK
ncbi:MAG: EamA family transporter [Deltaproteobacteria bacterium]|jgi:transporter family protein|nr:EamA family transporter [Deltaproteobacteria bacterium]